MPTFRHGRSTRILVDRHDLTTYFRDASMAQSADTAETTAFQSNTKTYVIGMTDGRISLGGMFSGDADGVDQYFQSVFGNEAPVVFSYMPENAGVGSRVWSASAYVTSYSVQGSVSDIVGVSAELQGTGLMRSGIVLASYLAAANVGAGASQDNAALTSNGGLAALHVPTNTRNGLVTVSIEHSANNSTFTTLATFTALGAGTPGAQIIEFPGTVNRYVRAFVTYAGTTGSANVQVNLVRK